MSYILLIIGFLFLVKGADYFVEGASSFAKKLRIPSIIIGLTIVAFGTSMPEAAVSITASLQGNNDIAVGNIVGSNIFNLLVVVGIAAMIKPLRVQTLTILKDFPFAILAALLTLLLGFDVLLQGQSENIVSRVDGVILLIFFGIFMFYLIEYALLSRKSTENKEDDEYKQLSNTRSLLYTLGGIVGIVLGGKFVVDGAVEIATGFGMSENLVGLTIVAVGTSLPELVTSIVAARKGESDIALGNVIGSNVFNVFFILGTSATIAPITVNGDVLFDTIVMILVTILAFFMSIFRKDINRFEGFLLFALYIAYMIYIIGRN